MEKSLNNLQHIAIIMDGNGRWAKQRGLPRIAGHKKGVEAVRATLQACIELGINYLTLYAFSSENWQRPEEEVNYLMELLRFYLRQELNSLHNNGVRLRIIGNQNLLPADVRAEIAKGVELTAHNVTINLNIALSYGARNEIIEAAKKLVLLVQNKTITLEDVDSKLFDGLLHTCGIPDPDLLIRTSGEQRLSNFLLWQSAYTELFFTKTLWPDFGADDLKQAVNEFNNRERRYGSA